MTTRIISTASTIDTAIIKVVVTDIGVSSPSVCEVVIKPTSNVYSLMVM